jgi:hypothetical protein
LLITVPEPDEDETRPLRVASRANTYTTPPRRLLRAAFGNSSAEATTEDKEPNKTGRASRVERRILNLACCKERGKPFRYSMT